MILFSMTVYDFADALVDGYCVTPSIVTKTSSADGGVFVKVKLVVVPSPVRLSIVLSDISKLPATSPINDANTLSVANDTLTFRNHRFVTGQRVIYTDGGGTVITGLADGTAYFIIKVDQNTIKLATSASNSATGTAIDLTGVGSGGSHTLTVSFDGVNTKFKATHNNGTKAKVSRPQQLTLSVNGVVQQPEAAYGIEADSTIVFNTAPVATDTISVLAASNVSVNDEILSSDLNVFVESPITAGLPI